MAILIIAMLFSGSASVHANPVTNVDSASHTFSVTLEVNNSLGVTLDGKPSTDLRVLKVGDPALGRVTYVMLDG